MPGDAIFYSLSLLLGVFFIPYALRLKISSALLFLATLSYILVSIGSHDRYLESYISLYLQLISNISIFSYIYFLIVKNDIEKITKIKNEISTAGIIIFFIIFIMEIKVGGLVKVDHVNLFGKDVNRNSIHPIVLCFIFTYSALFLILKIRNNAIKLNNLFFILAIVTMFLSNSRAGQAASLIIFSFYILSNYSLKKRYLLLIASLIPLILSFIFIDFSFLTERLNQSGENNGLESSRFIMWDCYFLRFEASQLILGLHEAGNDQCAYLPRVIGKNPHNSIIWSASVYGFITLFVVFSLLFNFIQSIFQKKYLFSLLLLCYIFIMNFERSYIVSPLDVPLLLLIFLPLITKKVNTTLKYKQELTK
ncbi:TPA: O-antigen ligase family protein [Providencia rettgeri]|nr:O-antigen ligase family protein [Providencia rettgeri]HEM7544028.1 O-antigen ligase family protein [Providencia rettgeri]HEM8177490.1 O-antigen ligase family protein [Providencia rettgeri]HEM8340710.1 O-antigen ligase family protein [Providencia rettgeri]